MMTRSKYWHDEAYRASTIEEARYCWTRAIEDDPEDFDARAELMRLGNGPMHAPRAISSDVIIVRGERKERAPTELLHIEPEQPNHLTKLLWALFDIATIAAMISLALAALRIAGFI